MGAIASTMNMGIALGKDGKLFTWGYGNNLNEVILKDEPTQLHLPNIGAIVKLEPGINTVIVTTDKGVRLALGIEENNMFDALSEDYRFEVESFERLDKINVGYDSILCSVVEGKSPVVVEKVVQQQAEAVENPFMTSVESKVIKVPNPSVESTDDQALVKKRSFRAFGPRQYETSSLKKMLGPELYREIVIRLTAPSTGYKGKNYDPNYMKRALGPKYDQSRDLDKPNVAWQGLSKYESKNATALYKQRTQAAKAKFGDSYDPDFAKKQALGDRYDPNWSSKVVQVNDPAQKKSQMKAKLQSKYGESYDPHFWAKKKYGDKFDPDYLKKVLGDKYDPSRQ